jgi:L-fuconolactonase
MLPEFPIVDTHLHLWDPTYLRYEWLDDIPILNRPYGLKAFHSASADVQVERMVFLQCEADYSQYRMEVDWVTELAEVEPRLQGMVPWAPIELGDAALDALAWLADNPLVKGVRRIIQFEEEDDFCLQTDFIEGVNLLDAFGLHFELCLKGNAQLRNAISLVDQCPNMRFVLDHIGKPFIKEGILEPWKSLIRDLASRPNTWCKISGLVTEADLAHWTPEDLFPYIGWVIECFGWDRVMYGGDWPVSVQATQYQTWVETLADAVKGASGSEQQKLFRDNAIHFYRL